MYKYIQKFIIDVHQGKGQNFPILIFCRYLVELGPRQLGSTGCRSRQICLDKVFENPSGHGCPHHKLWMLAPKKMFPCGSGDGEKPFDPKAFRRKGQECPQEIRTKNYRFILFIS